MSIGPEYKKQYGLIIPKGNKAAAPVKKRPLSSVFNVDSDEDDEVQVPKKPSSAFKNMKRQAKKDIQQALEEDPSVYQYDEIYDSMKEDKQKKVTLAKQDKTSKYAKNLIRNAAVRKLENDRHFERKCQRELEDEGDEFADKESFITSSYKNKLAELAVLEEEHKRMEAEERKNDVTKKKDLTDFYRDILSQRTADVATSVAAQVQETSAGSGSAAKSKSKNSNPPSSPPREPNPSTKSTESSSKSATPTEGALSIKKVHSEKPRTYRSRRVTSTSDHAKAAETGSEGDSGSEAEPHEAKRHDSEENMDRDDTGSSDSDDDEEGDKNKDGDEKPEGNDKDDAEKSGDEEEDALPKVQKLMLTEEEQKEERIKMVKESCKKRNTPETIQAAIERYWKRHSAVTA